MECRSDESGREWNVEVMRQAASCVAMKLFLSLPRSEEVLIAEFFILMEWMH